MWHKFLQFSSYWIDKTSLTSSSWSSGQVYQHLHVTQMLPLFCTLLYYNKMPIWTLGLQFNLQFTLYNSIYSFQHTIQSTVFIKFQSIQFFIKFQSTVFIQFNLQFSSFNSIYSFHQIEWTGYTSNSQWGTYYQDLSAKSVVNYVHFYSFKMNCSKKLYDGFQLVPDFMYKIANVYYVIV